MFGTAGGRSLELVEQEALDSSDLLEETCDNYFLGCELWALSFAKAGVEQVNPPPTTPESPGSDSTNYVLVPWDVMDKWLSRAHSSARKVPVETRMAWLRNRIEADLRLLIDNYRLRTDLSFGKVMKDIYAQTTSSWHYDASDRPPTPAARSRSRK